MQVWARGVERQHAHVTCEYAAQNKGYCMVTGVQGQQSAAVLPAGTLHAAYNQGISTPPNLCLSVCLCPCLSISLSLQIAKAIMISCLLACRTPELEVQNPKHTAFTMDGDSFLYSTNVCTCFTVLLCGIPSEQHQQD